MTAAATFQGFPVAALDFFDDLEADNSKAFWEDHKGTYAEQVRAPMVALLEELAPEFGTPKVFRPYRDLRFVKDKTRPYKEQVAGWLAHEGEPAGYYVQLAASGLLVGAGMHVMARDQVLRLREAVADERRGAELERLLDAARAAGSEVRGERLVRVPPEHRPGDGGEPPRADLLRCKSLTLMRSWPPTLPWLHTPEVLGRVRRSWRSMRPVAQWLDDHVGASAMPARRR